jgi:H+/gluconate symporter-like permease
MSFIGILVSLSLLMYGAYKGISVLILGPALAAAAILISGEYPVLAGYTEIYIPEFAKYLNNLPIFFFGAIFGKVMDASGAAKSIANFIILKLGKDRAILAVVLSTALLVYGGVSLFVISFTIYPIGSALFRAADVPKRFMPACIAFGAFTFATYAFPGSPQIQNALPMQYFGTTLYSAPILGSILGVIEFTLGMWWLNHALKKARKSGEGYGIHEDYLHFTDDENIPDFKKSITPIIVFFIFNLLLSYIILPRINGDFLTQKPFGTTLSKVTGTWALIISLTFAIISGIIINKERFKGKLISCLNEGAKDSIMPITNTGAVVGYGNVIKTLSGFSLIRDAVLGISKNPIIGAGLATTILCGITGSGSGGLSITLEAFAEEFIQMAQASNVSLGAIHRIMAIATGGLDSLPHNGGVITIITVCHLTHKESYKDIFVCTVIVPTIALIAGMLLAIMGIQF